VAGLYVMITGDGRAVVLTDPTVNFDPTAAELADITIMAAERARSFGLKPRVALLKHLGGALAIGPILAGMAKPVHVLSRGAEVTDIANIASIAVTDAQNAARLVGQRTSDGQLGN
jgi:phosphotransacetylase